MQRVFRILFLGSAMFALGVLSRPFLEELKPGTERTISPRIVEFEGMNAQPVGLVMLGDSLTDRGRWNEILDVDVANRGLGWDTVIMAANRTHEIPPGPVYVMIGINDLLLGKRLDQIAEDYRFLLTKLDGREVVVQSVLGPSHLPIPEMNAFLRELANEKKNVQFLDLTPVFGHPIEARFTIDGIHLTGEGYRLWAREIMTHLQAESSLN